MKDEANSYMYQIKFLTTFFSLSNQIAICKPGIYAHTLQERSSQEFYLSLPIETKGV